MIKIPFLTRTSGKRGTVEARPAGQGGNYAAAVTGRINNQRKAARDCRSGRSLTPALIASGQKKVLARSARVSAVRQP